MIADRAGGLPCIAADGTHAPAELTADQTAERPAVEKLLVGASSTYLGRSRARRQRAAAPPRSTQGSAAMAMCLRGGRDPTAFVAGKVTEALNYTCPACQTIVDPDPDGCIAMRCARCKRGFCWVSSSAAAPTRTTTAGPSTEATSRRASSSSGGTAGGWVKIDALLQRAAAPRVGAARGDATALPAAARGRGRAAVALPAGGARGGQLGGDVAPAHPRGAVRSPRGGDHLDADPDLVDQTDDRQMTALMGAAHGGHVAIVETLLLRGAAPTLRDDHGVAPLITPYGRTTRTSSSSYSIRRRGGRGHLRVALREAGTASTL